MAGLVMASLFGFIVWPIFAIISLSRKDFTAAAESYIRLIPPPIGDMLANTFLEGNRAVAKIDEKRIKLGTDISNALTQLSELATSVSATAEEGFKSLAAQTVAAASQVREAVPTVPALPTVPTVPTPEVAPEPTGGFHRRTKRKSWRTRRTQRRYARR
jgi:outer membrane biosynthesis protein TonB